MSSWHIHTGYILLGGVLALASWLGVHSWVAQHDWAVKAQMAVDSANVQVKTLNQQISTRDMLAHQQQQVIVKVIHDVQTPQDAANALPQVVSQPLAAPVVARPDGAWLVPQADVLPIFGQLADDQLCQSKLNTCTQDLADTKTIVTARDTEIATLKPKGFWKRLGGTLKAVGVGIGIGITLGRL